jgi:uroporphyrinogen III methyltransferase / synthase
MTVYLVGAGPGDPGLMTARALELIASAEVIVYDRLIPSGALDGARPDALKLYAGKQGGGESTAQEEIERLLLEHGSRGASVVRLKGGDPFVFGRGGEEAEALRAAEIEFEVVPGVTAGVAAPAYAGIPVTHRDAASAVAFVTGHEDPLKPESALDWDALARFPGTLVVYMGVKRLGAIAQRLLDGGRSPEEPAALVERGTLPGQREVVATLAAIAGEAERSKIKAPAIAVFGEVAALGDRLAWLSRRPLNGVSVAVTRARAQASGLAARLRLLGAEVVEAPAIKIVPLEVELGDLSGYDLVCLTSPNGVHLLFDALARTGRDARSLAGAKVAAIGPGTAAALREHGVIADVVPEKFTAEGLVDALAGQPARRVLVARAAEAREVLPDALRERGAQVDVIPLYETVAEALSPDEVDAALAADYVTFTSSSTVKFFSEAVGERISELRGRLVSIGPVTSVALREHGLAPDVEAARHDIDGVVEALVAGAGAMEGRRAPTSHERMAGRPWDASYTDGKAPWDIGVQPAVRRLVDGGAFAGAVLDAGCGSGDDSLLIASRGLDVLGVDVAGTAIARAREKATEQGSNAHFMHADALRLDRLQREFDTVLDCGLFHSFEGDERHEYAASLRSVTKPGGTVYVLCFSDAEPENAGPHPVSEGELRGVFRREAGWNIVSLVPDRIETTFAGGVPAWLARIERS